MTTPEAHGSLTIPDMLAAAVARWSERPALGIIREGRRLEWRTWSRLGDQVAAWTAAVQVHGVASGDRVAQLSPNGEGWIAADLAIQSAGAVHVPLHAALGAPQVAEQVAHAEASLLIVDSRETADRVRGHLASQVKLLLHEDLSAAAETAAVGPRAPLQPDDLATILYTSGTTGAPRGVMLTHRNIVANVTGMVEAVGSLADEIRLCFLPLSHIYARTCDLYCWLYRGTRLVLAESRDTILRDCRLAQPTVINAVPYFYQKVADSLRSQSTPVDGATIRQAFGGEIKRFYCGGAALAPETERLFAQCGMPILCGYGLTESAPVISATATENYSFGSVGRPLPNLEVRLADGGEVVVRGPNVMRGYWRDEAATNAAVQNGWLHTGDLGDWDDLGNLRIIGRRKEMIVLATGNEAAPTAVEQLLLGSPWIEQCCIVGDGRKCLAALIVPNGELLRQEIRRRRLLVWSRRRALTHPQVLALYREEIDRCLATAAEFEQVGYFTLIGRGFSVEAGEMTPKLSLRRQVIERVFAREIDAMYRDARGAKTPRLTRKD